MSLMEFTIRLLLPEWEPGGPIKRPKWDRTTDAVDDDPSRPLFLTSAADIFGANCVRLEVSGFFQEPLSVSADMGLVYLLEDLPGLISFLADPSPVPYTVGLWEQGLQVELSFSAAEGGQAVQVACSSPIPRKMGHNKTRVLRTRLIGQIVTFVADYREATRRYAADFLSEPWNVNLFAAAADLGKAA